MGPWRKGAGQFVADVVRGWESRTVVDRVELAVGRDLQYIRVNGTVVGAVVGCIIFLLSDFLLYCRPIAHCHEISRPDRKSVVQGTRLSVRLELGGRRTLQKK